MREHSDWLRVFLGSQSVVIPYPELFFSLNIRPRIQNFSLNPDDRNIFLLGNPSLTYINCAF